MEENLAGYDWITSRGKIIDLSEMHDFHLVNAWCKGIRKYGYQLEALNKELKLRNITAEARKDGNYINGRKLNGNRLDRRERCNKRSGKHVRQTFAQREIVFG